MSDPTEPLPPYLTVGTVLAGRYRVEGLVGRGGMGIVVRARRVEIDQVVALKVMRPDVARGPNVTRFFREAEALAQLKSEHSARIFDVGNLDDGTPFLVMELLEGRTVAELVDKGGAQTVADAVDIVVQALEALAEAHAVGFVHRDFKSSNLFLCAAADGARLVKVLDFGVSRLQGDLAPGKSDATTGDALLGSPAYMAPEQILSAKRADVRSDIWSAGVVLFELLAGRRPFRGETVAEVLAAVLRDKPPPLSTLRADVPEELERAVARCLEGDASKRFPDVVELAAALAPFGREETRVSARRVADVAREAVRISRTSTTQSPAYAAWTANKTAETQPGQSYRPAELVAPPRRRGRRVVLAVTALATTGFVAVLLSGSSSPPAPARAGVSASATGAARQVLEAATALAAARGDDGSADPPANPGEARAPGGAATGAPAATTHRPGETPPAGRPAGTIGAPGHAGPRPATKPKVDPLEDRH